MKIHTKSKEQSLFVNAINEHLANNRHFGLGVDGDGEQGFVRFLTPVSRKAVLIVDATNQQFRSNLAEYDCC